MRAAVLSCAIASAGTDASTLDQIRVVVATSAPLVGNRWDGGGVAGNLLLYLLHVHGRTRKSWWQRRGRPKTTTKEQETCQSSMVAKTNEEEGSVKDATPRGGDKPIRNTVWRPITIHSLIRNKVE